MNNKILQFCVYNYIMVIFYYHYYHRYNNSMIADRYGTTDRRGTRARKNASCEFRPAMTMDGSSNAILNRVLCGME